MRRMMRNRAAFVSTIFLSGLVLVAIFADFTAPYDPTLADFASIRQPPSVEHLLGTDEIGRDMLSRIIYGARISLFVGVFVQVVATSFGVTLGLIAGYYGGIVDVIMSGDDADWVLFKSGEDFAFDLIPGVDIVTDL